MKCFVDCGSKNNRLKVPNRIDLRNIKGIFAMRYADVVALLEKVKAGSAEAISNKQAEEMLDAIRERVNKLNRENSGLRSTRGETDQAIQEMREILGVSEGESMLEALNELRAEVATITSDSDAENFSVTDIAKLREESMDFQDQLTAAQKRISELEAESTRSLAERDEQISSLRKKQTISDVSRLTGANVDVLERLVDPSIDFVIEGSQVMVKEGEQSRPFSEFVFSNPSWKPFLPSLFETSRDMIQLPKGGTGGKSSEGTDPVNKLIGATYGVPSHLIEPSPAIS